MKELKGAILSQNHRRSQGGGPGGPGREITFCRPILKTQLFPGF